MAALADALICSARGKIAMAQPLRIIDALDRPHPCATIGSRWELIADRVMGGASSCAMIRETVAGRPSLRRRGDV